MLALYYLSSIIVTISSETGIFNFPLDSLRKWTFYKGNYVITGCMAVKRQNQNLNPELFNYKSVALITTYLFIICFCLMTTVFT